MISQCLESGVIFEIPISWPMNKARAWTSCARYRYKHDPSTIHKSRYIPTHHELKFSTSTLEWPMSWKLSWPAGDQGPLWRLRCFPTRGTEGIYQCTGTSSQQALGKCPPDKISPILHWSAQAQALPHHHVQSTKILKFISSPLSTI